MEVKAYALLFLLTNSCYDTIHMTNAMKLLDYYNSKYLQQTQFTTEQLSTYAQQSRQSQAYSYLESTDNLHERIDNSSIQNSKKKDGRSQVWSTATESKPNYIGLSLIKNETVPRPVNSNKNNTVGISAKPDPFINSVIVFPDDDDTLNTFTGDERKCFSDKQVYYNKLCQQLFTRGTCREGEWLILDLKSAVQNPPQIIPKCEKRKCNNTKLYWSITKQCYDLNEQTDESLCPPGNTLESDYFTGHGICNCKRNRIMHGLYSNGTCFPLYTQGPCSKNSLFVENDDVSECIRNPCKNSSLVLWEDGDKNCYELNTKGPCEENMKFAVSLDTGKPSCTGGINLLSIIGPPQTCVTNSNRVCQPEFKVDQGPDYIKRILISAKKTKR